MRVISRRRLREFWGRHADADTPLIAWYNIARRARWSSLADTRRDFLHADIVRVGSGAGLTVFNIGGNKYRLVVDVVYQYQIIYVKMIMTHAQYSKGKWKALL